MKADVLLATQYGGNLGHLGRLIALARAFESKGKTVCLALSNSAAARPYVESRGLPWVEAPALPDPVPNEEPVLNHADVLLRCGFGSPASVALKQVRSWQALLDRSSAGCVVADAAPWALYAARAQGRPGFALGHGFEIPPAGTTLPVLAPWLQDAAIRSVDRERALEEKLGELRQHVGPLAPGCLQDLYQTSSSILCAWAELDHFDRSPAEQHYVGPLWDDLSRGLRHEFRQKAGAKVLVYLNIMDKRYDLLWQALTQLSANVTVLSPGGAQWAHEAARGWGIEVVEEPVALECLLQQADAAIAHGGMAFTSIALLNAKPLLILPENTEQMILAYRLRKKGLALGTVRIKNRLALADLVAQILSGDREDTRPRRQFAAKYRGYRAQSAASQIAETISG